jgi:hypothetical protein
MIPSGRRFVVNKQRFAIEQITAILTQAELGASVADLCRKASSKKCAESKNRRPEGQRLKDHRLGDDAAMLAGALGVGRDREGRHEVKIALVSSQVALPSAVKSLTTGSKSRTWSWRSIASRWARPFSRSFWRWAVLMSVMGSIPVLGGPTRSVRLEHGPRRGRAVSNASSSEPELQGSR